VVWLAAASLAAIAVIRISSSLESLDLVGADFGGAQATDKGEKS
jgi:hypothetical protein